MLDHNALHIYTDGSCYSSPRRGGIGIRFVFPDYMNKEELDFCPEGYIGATNNQMELKACSEALEEVPKLDGLQRVTRIIIYTDSSYVVDNFYAAKYIWSKNTWKTKTGAPVLNTDRWKELIKEVIKVRKRIEIEKVKGHDGNPDNECCDQLAFAASKSLNRKVDTGYIESKDSPSRNSKSGRRYSRIKHKQEGEPCRKCQTPLLKRSPRKKPKPSQTYYYEWYLYCPNCRSMYMVEEAKRFIEA